MPRRRPRLRVVPDPADAVARPPLQRLVGSLHAGVEGDRRAALERIGAAALTGVTAVALLGALPFYPGWAPLLLGLLLGVLSLRRPFAASATALLLAIPLAGNLALGLVPVRGDRRPGLDRRDGAAPRGGCCCPRWRRWPRSPPSGRSTSSPARPRRAHTSAS